MDKIKRFVEGEKGRLTLTILVVILVGLASFELGRLSKNPSSGVDIEYPGDLSRLQNVTSSETASEPAVLGTNIAKSSKQVQSTTKAQTPQKSGFMASSRGSKYYPVNCPAGKNLKAENRIYFDTREAAESAGYTLSSSCR